MFMNQCKLEISLKIQLLNKKGEKEKTIYNKQFYDKKSKKDKITFTVSAQILVRKKILNHFFLKNQMALYFNSFHFSNFFYLYIL